MQKGSNITPERIRFDFNTENKLTESQIKEVEDVVNNIIKKKIQVIKKEMRCINGHIKSYEQEKKGLNYAYYMRIVCEDCVTTKP
jgi:alanyl-tRNA synthetase